MNVIARVGSIGRSNLLAQASRRCHLPPRPANSKACIKTPPRPARQGHSPPPAAVSLPPPSAAVRPTSCSSTPVYVRAPHPPVPSRRYQPPSRSSRSLPVIVKTGSDFGGESAACAQIETAQPLPKLQRHKGGAPQLPVELRLRCVAPFPGNPPSANVVHEA